MPFGLVLNKRLAVALAVGVVICLAYAGLFVVPRPVNFSYEGTTCISELVLLPGVERTVDASKFKLEYSGGPALGRLKFASTKTCFVPMAAPKKGLVKLAGAPFGGWVFRMQYQLAVGDAPRVLDAIPPAQSLSKPLALELNHADRVFQYYLAVGGREQLCTMGAAKLSCGVDKLGLAQGASYGLKLERKFGGKIVGDGTAIKLAVLPAAKVTATSIKPDELIYTKPQSADITFDKPLALATAKLEQIDGDKAVPMTAHVTVNGSHTLLAWDQELVREKTFRITLTSATATDGSTLDLPYTLNFRTSGGPKVLGASIGAAGVAGDARVVVTFDQALSKNANVAGLAGISGGAANISRQGDTQLVFALHDMPRCGAFMLNIAKGVVSAGGIASSQSWSLASRVSCRETRTIGYSVKGRPILAYFYGSGGTTVLFTGGIHGNEPSGTFIMQDWADYLDANGYKIPAGKQVVVVPNLNPDGIAADQRYNADNVNLDRNFPTSDWVSDIAIAGGQILPHGGGVVPLSEPETRAIADLTSSLHLRAEISFHSSGSLVGANKVADSVGIGTIYAAGVGYGTVFYDPEEVFGYTLTGEYETWEGEKFGAPAILIELPTSNGRYFSRHLNTLWAMVNL